MLIDDLCQVKVPMNQSGYDLLSALQTKTSFSDEETEFLRSLMKMAFVTQKALMERARVIARTFKPTPQGKYRGALL